MKLFAIINSFFFAGLLLAIAPVVWAHGTMIDVTADGNTVQVTALFETNEPMADAQIIVYAPDNPRDPWHTGVADANGSYQFDLDSTRTGEWAVTIRTAGHGEIVYLNVARDGTISVAQNGERSTWRTILLAGVVVLAFGGIAYYFRQTTTS